MDGGDLPAVHLCYIPQVLHSREMAPCDGDGGFFNFTGPKRDDSVAAGGQGEYSDTIK